MAKKKTSASKAAKTKKKASKEKPEEIVIDLKGKVLGRAASEIAFYLQGKHRADYQPNHDKGGVVVRVKNVKKVKVTGKKKSDKIYYHYSGYPGGMRGRSFEEVLEQDPSKIIRWAVHGMLPDNRLRKNRLNRLIVEE
ncbi:MAG: 50S ribosomal protein L13 [Candidatus Spechtbacterales bacterium]|nr:50S ribosomal protein L13 [Candidatus Spechtbacterales bacterium]